MEKKKRQRRTFLHKSHVTVHPAKSNLISVARENKKPHPTHIYDDGDFIGRTAEYLYEHMHV